MDRILRLISHRPWLVLAALAVITLLALTGIVDPSSGELRLVIDPSTNRLFPKDDPDREFYEFVRKLFGSDETMLVALSGDDIFTTDQLNRVKRMTERIEALPEVHHVVSLTTALNLTGNDDEIEVLKRTGPGLEGGGTQRRCTATGHDDPGETGRHRAPGNRPHIARIFEMVEHHQRRPTRGATAGDTTASRDSSP